MAISEIETSVGRQRTGIKWESRIIDIDLLLWGNDIVKLPQLTIPHYDLSNRDFFLIPLLELNPSLVHPSTGTPLAGMLNMIPDILRTHPEKIELA